MKKFILTLMLLGFESYLMALPTQLSGSLSGNYNDNGNTPDYIVIGDIYISSGHHVIFGSNVTIEFGNNGTTGYKFDIQAGAYLTANGASNGLIEFYPSNTTIGWGGINFYGTTLNSISRLRYCKISYAKKTVSSSYSYNATYCGGGIYIHDHNNLTIRDCEIIHCEASCGGGIFVDNSSPFIEGNTNGAINAIQYNSAIDGGGIYCYNSSTPEIGGTYCDNIIYNVASRNGGGIFIDETSFPVLSIQNKFDYNEADSGAGIFISNPDFDLSNQEINYNEANTGGGIYTKQVSADITDNTIYSNVAQRGGGIFCNSNSSPNISSNTITKNEAYSGGGVFCFEASPTIDQIIESNSATFAGGGMTISSSFSNPQFGQNTEINGNSSANGGGIYLESTDAIITGIQINGNIASDSGGGIYSFGGSPEISYNIITENYANQNISEHGYGGGIHCFGGAPSITYNEIDENSAFIDGGGIYVKYSNPVIQYNTSISDNYAGDKGGGIALIHGGGTISDENISGNTSENNGGGIYSVEGTVLIENTTIEYNHSIYGAGVYFYVCNDNSTPVLSSSDIYYNTTIGNDTKGAGIFIDGRDVVPPIPVIHPYISNNDITYNESTDGGGGGIFVYESEAYIHNNNILNNTATGDGGGIMCDDGSNPNIWFNVISDNNSGSGGGGIYCDYDSKPYILLNIFNHNTAVGNGGAINISNTLYSGYHTKIINNLLTNNSAGSDGGGVYLFEIENGYIGINSNTIADNTADVEGGGIYGYDNYGLFYNNIIWGNTAMYYSNVSSEYVIANYDNFYFSDIYGSSGAPAGHNNMDSNPVFGTGNYRLSLGGGSPCIDVGDNSADYYIWDLDFTYRIKYTTIDLGCYESDHTWILITDVKNNSENNLQKAENNIIIFPNPINDYANIVFSLKENETGRVIITDLNGKEVFNYKNNLTKGLNKIIWKIENNPKGIYFCKIIINNDSPIIKKVIVN